jgi:hypothetical protein
MYYIGLDVHKKTISYCVKDGSGQIHAEGTIPATHFDLDRWMKTLPQPWTAAMEATVFTGWIYDHLQPHAAALKVAHPLMLRAIAAAKKTERSPAIRPLILSGSRIRLPSKGSTSNTPRKSHRLRVSQCPGKSPCYPTKHLPKCSQHASMNSRTAACTKPLDGPKLPSVFGKPKPKQSPS